MISAGQLGGRTGANILEQLGNALMQYGLQKGETRQKEELLETEAKLAQKYPKPLGVMEQLLASLIAPGLFAGNQSATTSPVITTPPENPFGIFEDDVGNQYTPQTKEQAEALVNAGARRVP